MKIFWFDVETSGLDPKKHDILTLSAIVDIDGKVVDQLHLEMQPFSYENMEKSALEINGLDEASIRTFMTPQEGFKQLQAFLARHCNKFDKNDKYIPAGHNVVFDLNFLGEFYAKNGDKYLYSWLDYHKLCTASLVLALHGCGLLNITSFKLAELAKRFGLEIEAHTSKSDIDVTRQIFYLIKERLSFNAVGL